jgi:hypothetical protein
MRPLGCYDYPLRPDCMVQLLLPWNLTEKDVDRLTAFLRALIIPIEPEHPVNPTIQHAEDCSALYGKECNYEPTALETSAQREVKP